MSPIPPPLGPNEYVTWVRVEPDVFDLAGVLISSLTFTVLCVSIAFFLGSFVGVGLIVRRGRATRETHPSILLET